MMRFSKKENINTKRGFTLVETLVATAIIVLASVGPLALAGRSLSQANYIRDQITASFLAQEGLEIMRNVRDAQGGVTAIAALQGAVCSQGCRVSGTELSGNSYTVTPCTGSCAPLSYDGDENIYQYTSGSPSIFTRTIRIDPPLNGTDEYKVHAVVRWSRGYGTREIDLTENLFNRTWQ